MQWAIVVQQLTSNFFHLTRNHRLLWLNGLRGGGQGHVVGHVEDERAGRLGATVTTHHLVSVLPGCQGAAAPRTFRLETKIRIELSKCLGIQILVVMRKVLMQKVLTQDKS